MKKFLKYVVLIPIALLWDGLTFCCGLLVESCTKLNDYATESFNKLVEWCEE